VGKKKIKTGLMYGKKLGFDVYDENNNFKGSFSFRCMNCGTTGKFVPTLDWKHFCCVACTCVAADIDLQTESDTSQVRWEV